MLTTLQIRQAKPAAKIYDLRHRAGLFLRVSLD